MLVVYHRHHSEKNHQERREGKGFLERLSQPMLLDHTVECGLNDNDHQTHESHLSPLKCKGSYEQYCRDGLNHQPRHLALCPVLGLVGIEILQDLSHHLGQPRAIPELFHGFEQHAGDQSHREHGHRDGCHPDEELLEAPAGNVGDQKVLRFPYRGAHSAKGGAHRPVHQQAAQECPELIEIFAMQVLHLVVVRVVVVVCKVFPRRDAVIDAVEADRNADDHGGHGEGIEKRR